MADRQEIGRLTWLYGTRQITRRQLIQRLAAAGSLAALGSILAACGESSDNNGSGGSGGTGSDSTPTSSGTTSSGPKTGGTFTVGISADVVTLDPPMFTDVYSNYVSSQIHEGLIRVDFDGTIIPWLAKDYKLDGEKDYVFTLREGIKFHNGEELTSADVKYTIERLLSDELKSPRAGRLDMVESVETPDEYTVRFVLKEPFTPFLDRLTGAWAFIVNQKAVEAAGDDYTHNPVGTGPFKYVDWKTGESATVTRNEDYWGDVPLLETVVFRPIPDQNTRLIELESGGLDYMMDLPPEEVGRLKEDGKLQIFEGPAINYTYLAFNCQKDPFDGNIALRKAIAHAFDKAEIVEVIRQGLAKPAISSLQPENWAHNPNVAQYDYDPDKAREYFEESGYTGGPIELSCDESPVIRRVAERIQAQVKETLDLDITINSMEWGGFLSYIRTGEHQMFILGWNGGIDPDSIIFPLFATENFGAAGNRAFYSNSRVDQLLADAQVEPDEEKRKELYFEAQEIIADEVPHAPLYHNLATAGAQPYVKDFKLHLQQAQRYEKVWLDK